MLSETSVTHQLIFEVITQDNQWTQKQGAKSILIYLANLYAIPGFLDI